MGTSATAPVTADEDALRRARGAVARAGPGAALVVQESSGPGRGGTGELLGTTCPAVPRGC